MGVTWVGGWLPNAVARELFSMARSAPVSGAADAASAALGALASSARVEPLPVLRTIPALAGRLIAYGRGRTGFRTLVVNEAEGGGSGIAAIEIARQLARQRRQVILLDWSLDGVGLAPTASLSVG